MKKVETLTFFQGVSPWFWSKKGHFNKFILFRQYRQENVFYDILERENAFLGYKNKKNIKSKNWRFSLGVNPWFWSKNGNFFNCLFLGNIEHFSKGVNPWFWCKNGNFSNFFFLGNIGQENVFYGILERENAFLLYKNKKFKKSKNWRFCKGVNPWFWSNNGHFSNFFF